MNKKKNLIICFTVYFTAFVLSLAVFGSRNPEQKPVAISQIWVKGS